ncbi:MAG: hypothetical protein ABL918_10875 [Chakrabartia sp.]
MRRFLGIAFAVALVPSTAFAATCQENFVKKGNPLGGTNYTSSVNVASLTPLIAIRQMRGIAVGRDYDVISDEAEDGSMLLEQRQSNKSRAIAMLITATSEGGGVGKVEMLVKLPKGATAKSEGVMSEMCLMLNAIKGGKAGMAAAAAGKNALTSGAPTKMDAAELAMQLSREDKAGAALIVPRYKNRSFTLTGRVDYVIKNGEGYRVAYNIPEPSTSLVNAGLVPRFKTNISCMMAKGQSSYALSLKKGNKISLTGTFLNYDEFVRVMWLGNCRPSA